MAPELTYFKQVDGFRFLAVLSVMVSHYWAGIKIVDGVPLGFGVLFFFVLSSFLITRILLLAKQANKVTGKGNLFSLKQFYIRRFLRIFPAYYSLVIFLLVINWKPAREAAGYLLTYTINYKIGTGFDAGSFIHLWSLAVEEQFYVIFPFIVFFTPSKHLLKVFVAMALIGLFGRCALYWYNSDNIYFSNFHFISSLDSLGIGACLAYLYLNDRETLKRIISNKVLFTISGILFFVAMLFTYSLYTGDAKYNLGSLVVMRFLFSVFSFWVLGWAVLIGYSGVLQQFLENRTVIYLGKISYGIYLYHLLIPGFMAILLYHLGVSSFLERKETSILLIQGIIYITITIGIASVSWHFLEEPFNRLKRHFDYNSPRQVSSNSFVK